MSGVLIGLNFDEAFATARILGAKDERLLTEYLMSIEIGAVEGAAKSRPKG